MSVALPRSGVRLALAAFGPAFVASAAYVDPGNFATNFVAGSSYGYQLLWVIVLANLVAVAVQMLTAKVGITTGLSLPEVCRVKFGRRTNRLLWLQAEVVAMATDLAEFVGAAVGMRLLFGVPLLPAGLITGVVAFAVLGLQRRGARRFEVAIISLLALVAAGFGYLLVTSGHESAGAITAGLLPHLADGNAVTLAVGIVGATVMPHAIYLHSALQATRARTSPDIDRARLHRYNCWDCAIGLGAAGFVNIFMLCIAATLFHGSPGAGASDLMEIHHHLATMVGGGAALAFSVTLLSSGISSASVGTYAGQVVMSGFANFVAPLFARRAVTMVPALVVLACHVNPTQALIYSQVVLSFGIPFALFPLLLVTRDPGLMKGMVNRRRTTALMTIIAVTITALNCDLLLGMVTGRF